MVADSIKKRIVHDREQFDKFQAAQEAIRGFLWVRLSQSELEGIDFHVVDN